MGHPSRPLFWLPPPSETPPRADSSSPGPPARFVDAAADPAEATNAPPSPRLLHATLDILASPTTPLRPFGRACDWIDAAGPQSLRTLRVLNRLLWSAHNGGPAAPDISLPSIAAWAMRDSMEWPAEAWQGPSGQALHRRLARELRVSEALGGFDTDTSPPLAPPPLLPSCAALARCVGQDMHHGYLCDEARRWWCDVCWDHAQLPAAPLEEFLPGTGQPLLSLRFSILQVRLTSHFPSFTHFARSAREAGLLFRACDSMGGGCRPITA